MDKLKEKLNDLIVAMFWDTAKIAVVVGVLNHYGYINITLGGM